MGRECKTEPECETTTTVCYNIFGNLVLICSFRHSNSNYFSKWFQWSFCGNTHVAVARLMLILKGVLRSHASTWDIQMLEGGKSAKIFFLHSQEKKCMVNHCLTQKKARRDTLVPYACTIPQHLKKVRPKTSQSCLQILQKYLNIQTVWQEFFIIMVAYVYFQKINHDQAQKDIFSISIISEKLHWLHRAFRTFGIVSKDLWKQKIKRKSHGHFNNRL